MKNFFTAIFCCITFFTSFGQDSTSSLLDSGLKIQVSAGGAFLKNIESGYFGARVPLTFVEGGIEVGKSFNGELNFRGVFGSLDSINLNFAQINFGINNKSELNKSLLLVLRVGGGFIVTKNYKTLIGEASSSLDIKFLRIGVGLEQKISKQSVMTFNIGYDMSSNFLFNGLGVSVGVKVGAKDKSKKDVPYF
ncbi:MAG: hypothetical protein AB8H03_13665 [Saprospiraceae bacterium]